MVKAKPTPKKPRPTAATIKALNVLIQDPWFNQEGIQYGLYHDLPAELSRIQARAVEEVEHDAKT